jgi:hypothetical protein
MIKRKKFIKVGNLKIEFPEDTQEPNKQLQLEDVIPETSTLETTEDTTEVEDQTIKEKEVEPKKNNTILYLGSAAAALLFFLAAFAFLHHKSNQITTTKKKIDRSTIVVHNLKAKKPTIVAVVAHKKPKTKIEISTTTTTPPATTTAPTTTLVIPVSQVVRVTTTPATTIKVKPVKPLPIHLNVDVTNVSSGKSHVVSFQISTINSQGVVPYQKITIVSNSCSPPQITGETGIDGEFNTTVVCHNPSGILATVSSDNQSEIVNSSW